MNARSAVVALAAHPSSSNHFVSRIEAEASRGPGTTLNLRFTLEGELARLRVPARAEPVEADGLWRTTCFEAFVAESGADAYCEINLAPSRAWAFYRFSRYRTPHESALHTGTPPRVREINSTTATTTGALKVHATIDLESFVRPEAAWTLALTAVVEDHNGQLSYWSARHPAGKPDFHHRDGFALELAA